MHFSGCNSVHDKSNTFKFPSHVQLLRLRKANHQLPHWHLGQVLEEGVSGKQARPAVAWESFHSMVRLDQKRLNLLLQKKGKLNSEALTVTRNCL